MRYILWAHREVLVKSVMLTVDLWELATMYKLPCQYSSNIDVKMKHSWFSKLKIFLNIAHTSHFNLAQIRLPELDPKQVREITMCGVNKSQTTEFKCVKVTWDRIIFFAIKTC